MSIMSCQTDLLGFCGLECRLMTHLVIRELSMYNMHFVPFHRFFFKEKENYSQKDKKELQAKMIQTPKQRFLSTKYGFVKRNNLESEIILISTSFPNKMKYNSLKDSYSNTDNWS